MRNLLSRIYGRATDTRNVLYDFGLLRSYRIGVPVISVGNITVGGTGKTPLTILIARRLAETGRRPVVVTRGYRREDEKSLVVASDGEKIIRDARLTGDEPLEMALALQGKAAVVCDANRVRGAAYAVERLGAGAIVLDDAFQHRRIRRDLDIVAVDATDPFGSGRTLPAGRLRERTHNLSRADAVVLTRSDQADSTDGTVAAIRADAPRARVFVSKFETGAIVPLAGEDSPEGRRFFLFSGIGNPASLRGQLASGDTIIAGTREFPDHHLYSADDLDSIAREARAGGADALLTTRKDAVKLPEELPLPCFVVESDLKIENEGEFLEMLDEPFTAAAQEPDPEST